MNIFDEVKRAQTAKGSSALSLGNAILLTEELNRNSLPVHSMESYEVVEGQKEKPLRLDYSVLGLDGKNNWENHENYEISNNMAMDKLNKALEDGMTLECLIWS